MSAEAPWIPALSGSLAILCVYLSWRQVRRRRLIDDTPTSKTTGVFIGTVELAGKAIAEPPVVSYLAETPCVHYAWTVEEHWRKTVRETYTDSKGTRRSRNNTESGWKTVASGSESVPFFLHDDHGQIRVQPEGAELQTNTVFSETCTPGDELYFAKGPSEAIPHSTHRRRFSEEAIPQNAPVYLIGTARERQDVVAPEIAADENAPIFLISVHNEKGIRSNMSWSLVSWFLAGLALAYLSHFILPLPPASPFWLPPLLSPEPVPLRAHLPHLFAPSLFTLLWSLGWIVTAYNSIAGLRRRVEQAASNVDVLLKRRSDLLPQLTRVVQANAAHESSLQQHLAHLRTLAHAHPRTGADFRALAENYPVLSTDESFRALQTELSSAETRVALARSYHAEIASFFRTRTEILPDRWLCRLLPALSSASEPQLPDDPPVPSPLPQNQSR